jgi:NADP-dependent 3-hydroxy acid dehydrogenase YdfG
MKWALITGASAGIGEATAWQLARQGFSLFLLARRKDRLEMLQKKIEKELSVKVIIAAVDICDAGSVEAFVKNHITELKNLDVLVNNAGLAKGNAKLQDGQLSDWESMIETNVTGLLRLTRAVLPTFVANKRGHVVNLGSVAGRWVYAGGAVYCATKFAVRALSEGMRLDLMGTGVRVTNIEPGMVQTEFSLVRFEDQAKADQVYAGMKPLTAEDIAETIGWVVGRPAHVNIQELVIFPTDQASIRDVHRV